MTNMVDAAGTTKYAYTLGGLLYTEDGPFSNDTVTNTYVNRLRTALALQQPSLTWTNGFGYDASKRLTNITSQAGSFTNEYFPGVAGASGYSSKLIKRLLLPNLSIITNDYDSVARQVGTWLKTSTGTLLDSATYGYNTANQRTTFTNATGTNYHYTYDNIGQLKVAISSTVSESRGYAYDAAWNLSWRTNTGPASQFTVDTKNQYLRAPYPLITHYDTNGNLIDSQTFKRTYAYDDENRLIEFASYAVSSSSPSVGDKLTDFVYDGLGRMRRRLEYHYVGQSQSPLQTPSLDWQFDSETDYIYDGLRVIQERDVGSGVPTVSYTRGNDLSGTLEGAGGIGGLLARSSVYSSGNWSTHNFYHADGNGNITYLVNSSQALAASYRYDPFGSTMSSSGTLAGANVYRFSSKEIHVNSGMYYYLFRFYDPNLQRWINRDPLGDDSSLVYAIAKIEPRLEPRSTGELAAMAEAVLDPLSTFTRVNLNLYGAVGNNPVNNIDPLGLDFASCYADCIEKYRDPVGNGIAYVCNAGLNKAVGGTGRTGIGGAKPHPTTWQHKLGSKFGSVGSKIGKAAGRAAVVLTIADGFFDLGLLPGCAAACAGE